MDRRNFLKGTGTLLAGATLATNLRAPGAESGPGGRIVLPINRGWRYSSSVPAGGHERDFNDEHFEQIVVPHTNIRLPWHSFDNADYEFVSLYRRHFRLPVAVEGHKVFVDFEGVMTASTVWINGVRVGEYRGGYTPFSFELTPHLDFDRENVLAVEVDSHERPDIPPFGGQVDYLTFGGIYREVSLRVVPATFIENIFARPRDVLGSAPSLDIDCWLQSMGAGNGSLTIEAALLATDTGKVLASAKQPATAPAANAEATRSTVSLPNLQGIALWDLERPQLYTVRARLLRGDRVIDQDTRRCGFREAVFTDHGFTLNGKVIKLRGLDRHQMFPFVGQAMPARVQRRDAQILKQEFHCNIVRTSHYPQSRHFLDACDDLGLLVLEEIPGWQHIGDQAWKDLSVDNLARMIRRDWNHPAIVLWGVRINESPDDHDFYTRTNAVAHQLDPTRQTGGIRNFQESEFLEDVFTVNDFGWPLKPPNHPRYLNTEFVGHTYPVKQIDDDERHREHTIRHARIHDQLASNPQYSGGIGWCAFDYNTHHNFGAGDRICYHGVADIFREPKPAAGFYKSQVEPEQEIVLEPAFHWAYGDEATRFSEAVICSNCDHVKLYVGREGARKLLAEADPDRKQFPHLKYPPFSIPLSIELEDFADLHIEGYRGGKLVITRDLSGGGVDREFVLLPDDKQLLADGADCTRVVMRVTDEFGNIRPYANAPILLSLEGPGDLIGDNPFALFGGRGAVWIRAREATGDVRLTAKHPRLGSQTVELTIMPAPSEAI